MDVQSGQRSDPSDIDADGDGVGCDPIVESPSRHRRCEWSDLDSTLGLAGRGGSQNRHK
jgi:hypothetical protein